MGDWIILSDADFFYICLAPNLASLVVAALRPVAVQPRGLGND
jgi:hypothetical protein